MLKKSLALGALILGITSTGLASELTVHCFMLKRVVDSSSEKPTYKSELIRDTQSETCIQKAVLTAKTDVRAARMLDETLDVKIYIRFDNAKGDKTIGYWLVSGTSDPKANGAILSGLIDGEVYHAAVSEYIDNLELP